MLTIYDEAGEYYMKQNKEKALKIMTESQILDRLEASRKQAEQGMVMDADEAVRNLKAKYRLQSQYYTTATPILHQIQKKLC